MGMSRVKFEVPCRLEFWSPGGKSTSMVYMYIYIYIYLTEDAGILRVCICMDLVYVSCVDERYSTARCERLLIPLRRNLGSWSLDRSWYCEDKGSRGHSISVSECS